MMRRLICIMLLSVACSQTLSQGEFPWEGPVDDDTKTLISVIQSVGYTITSSDKQNKVVVAKAISNLGGRELTSSENSIVQWDPFARQFVRRPADNTRGLTSRSSLMSDLYGEHQIHVDFSKSDAGSVTIKVVALGVLGKHTEASAVEIVNHIAKRFREAGGKAQIRCAV